MPLTPKYGVTCSEYTHNAVAFCGRPVCVQMVCNMEVRINAYHALSLPNYIPRVQPGEVVYWSVPSPTHSGHWSARLAGTDMDTRAYLNRAAMRARRRQRRVRARVRARLFR